MKGTTVIPLVGLLLIIIGVVVFLYRGELVQSGTNSTTSTQTEEAPRIDSITPTSGPAGTLISIHGTGFTSDADNLVLFGDANGRHHPDGSPDNSHPVTLSSDGKTIVFTVPNTGPSGILCDESNHCVGISALLLSSGDYKIAVKNKNGTSNTVTFTLTK